MQKEKAGQEDMCRNSEGEIKCKDQCNSIAVPRKSKQKELFGYSAVDCVRKKDHIYTR